MRKFTIELTDEQLVQLQAEVDLYNMNNGTTISVADFLQRHARERAVMRQLQAHSDQLAQDHQLAVAAIRERLIDGSALRVPHGERIMQEGDKR